MRSAQRGIVCVALIFLTSAGVRLANAQTAAKPSLGYAAKKPYCGGAGPIAPWGNMCDLVKAMMKGSGGIGGRRYQVAALLLTYGSVSMAAVPIAISQLVGAFSGFFMHDGELSEWHDTDLVRPKRTRKRTRNLSRCEGF